jgi:hypothetical protein
MVCVDLMDSFTIRTPAKTHSLLALTMIDPVINTDWFEIVKATNKSETSIQDLFHNSWLARYPQPQFTVFDNGSMGEFKREFKRICGITIMALKSNQLQVTTNIKQSNTINENFHLL